MKMKRQPFSNLILLSVFISLNVHSQQVDPFRMNNIFRSSLMPPARIEKTGASSYFIDFGKDAFGTLVLKYRPEKQDTLRILLGEKLISHGMIDPNPGGSVRYQEVSLPVNPSVSEYILQLKPYLRNTVPPAVQLPDTFGVIMPFRYCEIHNLLIPVEQVKISRKTFNYYFNENSSYFSCSDTLLNRIWDLCKYSIKATSFCGLYIDGERERIPYEADALINQLGHYCVDNEYSLARRSCEHFMSNPTWPTEWILTTVLLFYNDFLYTGNSDLLKKYYDALRFKTLIDIEREDGLISSFSEKLTPELIGKLGFSNTSQKLKDIVDWPPSQSETTWKLVKPEGERDGYDMRPVNTVVNSFHYMNMELMSVIAGYLGKEQDSLFFRNRAIAVKEAINNKLIDKTKGIYIDGEGSDHSSLHANMFPLVFGLVPEKYTNSVIAFIKTRGMACSVYGSHYLLEALYRYNEADYALDLMTATHDRSWYNMIRSGSTITMEAWDMKYKPNSDWNHAWGAAPANIIPRFLWGITPVEPGFKGVQIRPQFSRLTSAKIMFPTIKGPVTGEYTTGGRQDKMFKIGIPPGMKAEFVSTPQESIKVILNGKSVKNYTGKLTLMTGINTIVLKNP
jgi:hypothetical protein